MGKSKKLACLNLNPILGILLIVINTSIFAPGPDKQKAVKQQEKEKLAEIEQKIKTISENECIAKYISTLVVEDDDSMYRIYLLIYPLFMPESYEQVQTWTDAVCMLSKRILDNYGLVRDISVWAIQSMGFPLTGNGGLMVYGRTLYDHNTGKFEFKRLIVE